MDVVIDVVIVRQSNATSDTGVDEGLIHHPPKELAEVMRQKPQKPLIVIYAKEVV